MQGRGTPICWGVALCALLAVGPAAGQRHLLGHLCLTELIEVPELVAEIPIPVGCEVIDCCPGCPGPGPIDWRIRVGGEVIRSVELTFEGVEDLAGLRFDGDARARGNVVRFGRGETLIAGLPFATRERVAVASLRVELDPAVLKTMTDDDQGSSQASQAGARDLDSFEIAIHQLRGPFVVNEYSIRYVLRRCLPWYVCDTVTQTNNRAGDRSVILLDGRRSGGSCDDDVIYRSAGTARVGNVVTPGGCNSEVVVFSTDDANELLSPVTSWTDDCGDDLVADLDPILQAPVNVWLVAAGTAARATNDLANANLLYNQNKTGISFTGAQNNVSGNATAVATIGTAACTNVAGVQTSAFYVANQLNVYYVGGAFTGGNCTADRNQVYIGTLGNPGSLPHEFGHSFSLFGNATTGAHTNSTAGFTSQNIMWGGGPGTRNHFSLGQAFRFNLDANSSLNINGVRVGATRTCQALTTSATCPALALDWVRP